MSGTGTSTVSGWDRAWRPTDPWIVPAVAAMALLRVVTVLLTGPGIFPDSKSYRGGWLDLGLTSLVGDSVRPWGVTLWMALWPSTWVVIVAQALLAAVCWTFLARELWLLCRSRAVARAALVLVLVVASVPALACWDAVITSESVSISSGILALALLLRAVRLQTWQSVLWFVLGSLWFAMTRPLSLVIVLAWAVVCLVILLVVRRSRAAWGLAALALVLVSGYSYATNQKADDAWTRKYGFSRTTSVYGYNLGWNPVAASVIRAVREETDAPACMIPAKPAVVTLHGPAYWVGTTAKVCPGMNEWATTHWPAFWRSYLLHHRGQAWKIVQKQVPMALAPTVYGNYRSGIPLAVQDLVVAQAEQPTTPVSANFLTVPALAWFSAALVLLLMGARALTRRDVAAWTAMAAAAAAAFVSIIGAVLVIQTPHNENGRENVASTSLIVVTAVALAILGADLYADRRRSVAVAALAEQEVEA